MFNLDKSKYPMIIFMLLSVSLVVWLVYKIVTSVLDSTSKTNNEQNVAVAVKAKADLESATEKLNKASESIALLQEKIIADDNLREKNKEITESNKKELEKVIMKIETINNTEVSYEETDTDKLKSEIIIDSIWDLYKGEDNVVKK